MVPGTPVGSSIVTQRVGIPGKCRLNVAVSHVECSLLNQRQCLKQREIDIVILKLVHYLF